MDQAMLLRKVVEAMMNVVVTMKSTTEFGQRLN